jgi:hypothetical protein
MHVVLSNSNHEQKCKMMYRPIESKTQYYKDLKNETLKKIAVTTNFRYTRKVLQSKSYPVKNYTVICQRPTRRFLQSRIILVEGRCSISNCVFANWHECTRKYHVVRLLGLPQTIYSRESPNAITADHICHEGFNERHRGDKVVQFDGIVNRKNPKQKSVPCVDPNHVTFSKQFDNYSRNFCKGPDHGCKHDDDLSPICGNFEHCKQCLIPGQASRNCLVIEDLHYIS